MQKITGRNSLDNLRFEEMTGQDFVYGLMSGTSLDGVDIAACSFVKSTDQWQYKIHYSATISYTKQWQNKLLQASSLTGEELIRLDREYGDYLGTLVNATIEQSGIKPFLIASHGHTIFHSPKNKYSLQIGCGAQIAAQTGISVVCDFRSTDIALGGQGAPLVPIGDKLLFGAYDACLNLGGFANISFESNGKRIAFDICPVNIVLNRLASTEGHVFDQDGETGRRGKINSEMLGQLNSISYYVAPYPKSLSREWVQSEFDPILELYHGRLADFLRTGYEHMGIQIGRVLDENNLTNILVTGGGVHNNFLMERIRQNCGAELVIPDKITIDYKEALIFAFMGLLRLRGEVNCLASVTGASDDSVCGVLYLKKGSGL
jgi:anhydro-N-acetylmuramic acid kinase